MYFKTYAPSTKSENCETARAFHTYNAVHNFCDKDEPRFPDFVAYRLHQMGTRSLLVSMFSEKMEAFEISLRPEWAEIREIIRNAGQPLRDQFVVYFAIIDGGLKCGETGDLVQRYCNINRKDNIHKLWYLNVENEEQARHAERALHTAFDHARCLNRKQNKKDYYEGEEEAITRFLNGNMKKIFEAIVAEVAKAEG